MNRSFCENTILDRARQDRQRKAGLALSDQNGRIQIERQEMKTYPKIEAAELKERRRLRPLWELIKELAHDANPNPEIELKRFMAEHDFTFGDLVALRQRPFHWDRFTADSWAWLLHRTMNNWK